MKAQGLRWSALECRSWQATGASCSQFNTTSPAFPYCLSPDFSAGIRNLFERFLPVWVRGLDWEPPFFSPLIYCEALTLVFALTLKTFPHNSQVLWLLVWGSSNRILYPYCTPQSKRRWEYDAVSANVWKSVLECHQKSDASHGEFFFSFFLPS